MEYTCHATATDCASAPRIAGTRASWYRLKSRRQKPPCRRARRLKNSAPGSPESLCEDALSAFERSHTHRAADQQLQGTVVSLTADQVVLDIGYKMEGVLPRSAFPDNAEGINPGDSRPRLHHRPQ
jgi:hypothetical protein